jgi:hypothetical protein
MADLCWLISIGVSAQIGGDFSRRANDEKLQKGTGQLKRVDTSPLSCRFIGASVTELARIAKKRSNKRCR